MIRLILYFDGLAVDDIFVNSVEEALDVFENHSFKFEEQNEDLKRWWIRTCGNPNPIVEIRYEEPIKDKYCPFCGKPLYPTDVIGYDYTCYDCDYFKDDTNFYSCEVD